MLTKILSTIASFVTIAFGAWHFTVPKVWNWYKYIAPEATELVLAVRATNVFFSLSLVLIGLANLAFLYISPHKPSLIIILTLSSVLWLVRLIMQLVYPQGSMNIMLQYGMLFSFAFVFVSYAISLYLVLIGKY